VIFKTLDIDGFRSFEEKETFTFSEIFGFFHLLGINGAGKSSIWDALTWVLFGKTARGLKASSVKNWQKKAYSVTVAFEKDSVYYILNRGWNPNRLVLAIPDAEEARTITQQELEDLIGFDYTSFLNVILMGQFNRFFFDLVPAEKLQIFSDALDLHFWLKASDTAKKKTRELENEINDEEKSLAELHGEKKTLLEQRDGLQVVIAEFEGNRERDIKILIKIIDTEVKKLGELEGSFELLREKIREALEEEEKVATNGYCADESISLLDEEIRKNVMELGLIKYDLKNYAEEKEKMRNAIGTCPFCNQAISEKHVEKELARIENKVARSEVAARMLGREMGRTTKKRDGLKQKNEERYDWGKGFKELRLWLIEDALKELEIEVGNSLIQLGLKDWHVSFDIERENKSGGVTKGFSVFITAPGSPESVPWEAWSGGETQRLRVAGAIGLANLISNRRSAKSNIEIWDEPTAHLTEEGIQDLLNFFEERARNEEKQIWLVDHRSLDYGGFDKEIEVVKDKEGSHILVKD